MSGHCDCCDSIKWHRPAAPICSHAAESAGAADAAGEEPALVNIVKMWLSQTIHKGTTRDNAGWSNMPHPFVDAEWSDVHGNTQHSSEYLGDGAGCRQCVDVGAGCFNDASFKVLRGPGTHIIPIRKGLERCDERSNININLEDPVITVLPFRKVWSTATKDPTRATTLGKE